MVGGWLEDDGRIVGGYVGRWWEKVGRMVG